MASYSAYNKLNIVSCMSYKVKHNLALNYL